MTKPAVVILSGSFLLAACVNPQSYNGGASGTVLTTTGPNKPVFTPGRADRDRYDIAREFREIDERIEQGRDNGALTKREARKLRQQSARVEDVAERYGRDGFSESEKREIEARTRILQEQAQLQSFGAGSSEPD